MKIALPIDAIEVVVRAARGPLVITASPGSGKSTRVPLWFADYGSVLAVQPRRMAARSLAHHLAQLDGSPVGKHIGFAVRGESADRGAKVLFVTTGVALRLLEQGLDRFQTVILDEFHERSLDLDLLAALVRRAGVRLVILSATIDAQRVASHFGATHFDAPGRNFPVDVRHLEVGRALPTAENLGRRVAAALRTVEHVAGDRLVFVPGKAEIREVCAALEGRVVPLHGGLTLREQNRALQPGTMQRTVVATNVAETSLTIPGVTVVVDTGLVRRTHYHQDRGYLALLPIARDSAEQRSGRAGRLGPGVSLRLWGPAAPLDAHTPPAVHRESLVNLVLGAIACGEDPETLQFVDTPPAHALDSARAELTELGALQGAQLTELGRELFRLPTAPHLARFLTVARTHDLLGRAIDLVAALNARRSILERPAEELEVNCDLTALLLAMEIGDPQRHGLNANALQEARKEAKRLRSAFGHAHREPWTVDRMAKVLIEAWPRCAHVARDRKRYVAWSNGGTEVDLSRRSRVPEGSEAVLALGFRAHGAGARRTLEITAAVPRTRVQLASLGLGTERIAGLSVHRRRVFSAVETVYAGSVLRVEERVPTGELAAPAIGELLLRGSLRKGFAARFEAAHRRAALWSGLEGRAAPERDLVATLRDLGLEHPDDLELLEDVDLLPKQPPPEIAEALDREFPEVLELGNHRFRVEVRVKARTVLLHNLGARIRSYPPVSWLPRFRGWDVVAIDRGVRRHLRRT